MSGCRGKKELDLKKGTSGREAGLKQMGSGFDDDDDNELNVYIVKETTMQKQKKIKMTST